MRERRAARPGAIRSARFFEFTFGLTLAIFFFCAGCSQKTLSKSQIRAVTSEVVAAAQRVSGRKSDITIRPEFQPVWDSASGEIPADGIFVSLPDASKLPALRQALAGIARRHHLSLAESSSGAGVRFDYSFRGNRTQAIHVIMPLAAHGRLPSALRPGNWNSGNLNAGTRAGAGSGPALILIIDDLGYDRAAADQVLSLDFPLTISVIPHLSLSSEIAEEANRRGDQVLLHLPMESEVSGVKNEDIELRPGMTQQQVGATLAGMLETVPYAVGVNNHQGSRATSDAALMAALMPELRARNLFFVDSRTTAATVAYATAEKLGVRAASRKIFLDDTPSRAAILAQLDLAARDAQRDGFAIAIGHPHPETIATLAQAVPQLQARGIRLAFPSSVVR
ncbi:MAG: divergent polysaccharide deacetylase family protein [Candidatus Acidiferrales bacterium]